MSLHPDLERMLAADRKVAGPTLQEMGVDAARILLRDKFLDRGFPLKYDAEIRDIVVGEGAKQFRFKIYRPPHTEGQTLPILLSFHGGGFVLGDSDACDMQSRAFASLLNVAVVCVDYRLAPEHKFPAPLEDAKATLDWLKEHGRTASLNPDEIVITGESAGGNISINAGLYGAKAEGVNVKGLTILYPVTDMRAFIGAKDWDPSMQEYGATMNLDMAELDWFWSHYLSAQDEALLPENSVIEHPELQTLPPTHIFQAECDPLHDMGVAFHEKLLALGVDTKLTQMPGMLHSCMFHGKVSPRALRYFFEVVEAIDHQFQN